MKNICSSGCYDWGVGAATSATRLRTKSVSGRRTGMRMKEGQDVPER